MADGVELSGAEYLASIFGTEKDKVNCSFYFKIGACRHGDKCSRTHNRPNFSQTIVMKNLYHNPKLNLRRADAGFRVSDAEEQKHFDEFFEEIFTEVEDKYGEIEEMNVCDNIGEHMIGNVYIKFRRETDAQKAENALNQRWFDGRPIYAQLSPVTDFREACCRQYEMGECTRGGFCNFMHLKPISYELRRDLFNRDNPWRDDCKKKNKRKKKRTRRRHFHRESTSEIDLNVTESETLPKAYIPVVSESDHSDSGGETSRKKSTDRSPSLPAAFRLDRFATDSELEASTSGGSERSDSRSPSPYSSTGSTDTSSGRSGSHSR